MTLTHVICPCNTDKRHRNSHEAKSMIRKWFVRHSDRDQIKSILALIRLD